MGSAQTRNPLKRVDLNFRFNKLKFIPYKNSALYYQSGVFIIIFISANYLLPLFLLSLKGLRGRGFLSVSTSFSGVSPSTSIRT